MMNDTKKGVIEPQVRDFERRYQVTLDLDAVLAACEDSACLACDDAFLKTFAPPGAADKSPEAAQSVADIETIFREEFSPIAGAVMAPAFAGLISLLERGMFARARILVSGITEPPPGITAERMEEVKTLILSKIPE